MTLLYGNRWVILYQFSGEGALGTRTAVGEQDALEKKEDPPAWSYAL